jgi:LysM repeat protein
MPRRLRLWLARLAAPAALLLAATVAVLLVRSALESGESSRSATTPTVERQPTTTRAQPPPGPPPAAQNAQFYRVRAGDTLETIADQFGTTVEELLALNPDVDPVELSIGQRIRVQ